MSALALGYTGLVVDSAVAAGIVREVRKVIFLDLTLLLGLLARLALLLWLRGLLPFFLLLRPPGLPRLLLGIEPLLGVTLRLAELVPGLLDLGWGGLPPLRGRFSLRLGRWLSFWYRSAFRRRRS